MARPGRKPLHGPTTGIQVRIPTSLKKRAERLAEALEMKRHAVLVAMLDRGADRLEQEARDGAAKGGKAA